MLRCFLNFRSYRRLSQPMFSWSGHVISYFLLHAHPTPSRRVFWKRDRVFKLHDYRDDFACIFKCKTALPQSRNTDQNKAGSHLFLTPLPLCEIGISVRVIKVSAHQSFSSSMEIICKHKSLKQNTNTHYCDLASHGEAHKQKDSYELLTRLCKCFSGKYLTQGYNIWVLNFFPHVDQYHALCVNKTKTWKRKMFPLNCKCHLLLIHQKCE